jgi:beta propeller repeat protein
MKMQLVLLGVIAVTLVLFLGAVSAATPEKRVTTVNSVQYEQSSDGTKVVWVDKRSGVENIYVRDLASSAPEIAVDAKTTRQTSPDISGNLIVWQDQRKVNQQIYYKDRKSTGKAYPVNPGSNSQLQPKISGYKVIWEEWTGGVGGKYLLRGYDLQNDEELNLPTSANNLLLYDIEGNNVLYRANSGDIKLFDLISQNDITIDIGYDARISGDNIIYKINVGGGKHILKLYNIASKSTVTISNSVYSLSDPAIYGIIAVWTETTDTNALNIFMKNISQTTNPLIKVSENKYKQVYPTISGHSKIGYFVSWMDYRNGLNKPVLYCRNMETIPPSILSTVPKNNQWGVNRFSSIAIKFNKFINPGANYSKIIVRNLATNQNIALTKYMKYDTLVIKTAAKRPRTFYQVILPAKSVISVAANNLSTTRTITFRTRA